METNQRPTILWHGCRPEQMARCFRQYEREDCTYHAAELKDIIAEMEDILSRLFARAEIIWATPLTQGFSGAVVLKVQPSFPVCGGARPVVVKLAHTRMIEQEYWRYQMYVRYFIGNGHSTVVLDWTCNTNIGGIVYSFVGTDISTKTDNVKDFGSFYARSSITQIKQVLANLFRHTCGLWYANQNLLQPLDLTSDYRCLFKYSMEQLEQLISRRLPSVVFHPRLTFTSLRTTPARTFTNPFSMILEMQPFVYPSYIAITHGDFNPHNILIDQSYCSWLIDFQSTRPSHILRDVAMLDAVIRFQLLYAYQATLEERLVMEEALCSVTHFSQLDGLEAYVPGGNPALAKAFTTAVYLRLLARWIVEKNPMAEINEYYVALLYATLNTLRFASRFASLESVQREHALLSASLLTDLLSLN